MLRRAAMFVSWLLASTVLVPPSASPQPVPAPIELRVMTFNIWYGATQTDGLPEVIEAIRRADADVVGMQEPYARLRRVAAALGFHVAPGLHVISRYPILQPEGGSPDIGYLLLGPGAVAAIANTHLPCCPYTPYRIVHRGMARPDALRQERATRLRTLLPHLDALAPVLGAGVPTFFTGDFNAPSHRDWTREAVAARGLPYPIRWPVSLAMEDAGFVDSYRAVRPDPVADPGFTWTPGYPPPLVSAAEVHDRIDFVWATGPATPTASIVVGESRADADLVVRPYPADHRAVVSTFDVVPAEPPVMVAALEERSRPSSPFDVAFHAPGGPGEHVVLVDPATGSAIDDRPTGPEGTTDGNLTFAPSGLEQGRYEVILLDGSDVELARDSITLVEQGQPPVLDVADATLRGDQLLEVSWRFAPGNRFDWLGVYRASVSSKAGTILAWRYLGARIEGASRIGPGARGAAGWPLRPGRYDVRICLDDSYRCRVVTPFRVLG